MLAYAYVAEIRPKNSLLSREKSMVIEEKIVQALKNRNYTITTAESCTGGLLAGRILNVSGASAVYNEGHMRSVSSTTRSTIFLRCESSTE